MQREQHTCEGLGTDTSTGVGKPQRARREMKDDDGHTFRLRRR